MVQKKYGDFNDKNNEFAKLIPYLEYFLDNYSNSSKKHLYLNLVNFAVYCKERFNKNILDVKGPEILTYFKEIIDIKEIEINSKRRIRTFIRAYYHYVQEFKKQMEGEEFIFPVPSSKIWDFSGKEGSLKELKFDIPILKMEDVKDIIKHLYYTKPYRTYIIMSLIIFSGARISEVLNIKLEYLFLDRRWFITEVKSKKNDKRDGIYFIPEFFIPELKHFIDLLKLEHQDPNYLFPSRNGTHYSPRSIQRYMRIIKKELGIKASINPHSFRDFLNTKRFEKGCNQILCKFLLNQKVRDVNPKHYLKAYKNRVKLRNAYDKYNPFNKSILPNPKLL